VGAGGVDLDMLVQPLLLHQFAEYAFGCGRTADIAETNE
jgi:hypothetical protein